MTTLITERLLLRRWRAEDREPFALLNADPEVMRYFVRPLDREESDAFIDRTEASFDELGYGVWAVERRSDGRLLGFTGLWRHTFEAPFTPAVEIGWRFATEAWGQGYATEAARAALRFGFEIVGLDTILSWTSVLNTPSIRVMERLGMTHDPDEDFDHPRVPVGHLLRRHVLYRLDRLTWRRQQAHPSAGS
ncbi:MAG TPA: GNAT family N-acetyltransferase [Candidatus Dormibacteraeota bacterium]|nr:GNAT family N-acetyltransferase [Candidatus Dormibacteraeota bacterium]